MKNSKRIFNKYQDYTNQVYHSEIDVELALENRHKLEDELYNHILCLKPTELFELLDMLNKNVPYSHVKGPIRPFDGMDGIEGLF